MNKTLWAIETLEPEAIYCFITRYATNIDTWQHKFHILHD